MTRTLYLKDSNGIVYTFDDSFRVEGLPFSIRINNQEIAFSHGAKDTGDNKVSVRQVVLTGLIHDSDADTHDSKLQALYTALTKINLQLYWNVAKYINVKSLKSFASKNVQGADGYVTEVTLTLNCVDPFFYNVTPNARFVFLNSSPQTFVVSNPGSIDAFPIFGMTTRVSNVSFALANITAGLSFAYSDAGFTAGKTISINCQLGEVENSGLNTIRYFEGMFLPLLPGDNTFSYVGATIAGLSIFFNERNL
jgi:hypothetical protein